MNLVHLRCPDCGAELEVDNIREFCFCQYCGTKIILEESDASVRRTKARLKTIDKFLDQREAQHARKIDAQRLRDEAKIKAQEQKQEFKERKFEEKQRTKKRNMIIGLVLLTIWLVLMVYAVTADADYTIASTDTGRSDTVQSEYQIPGETHHHSESRYEYHESS